MDNAARPPPTALLTLRLWQEPLGEQVGEPHGEWRGEVKNVMTGEVRYFRQWSEIGDWVAYMIDGSMPPSCIEPSDPP